MTMSSIEPIAIRPLVVPELDASQVTAPSSSFMQALGSEVQELNGSLMAADSSARALAAGENIPVQDVMIAMEHAHLKLQFAVEVRNRVVDAYQNLTSMQV